MTIAAELPDDRAEISRIAGWNAKPTPFRWSAKADAIVEQTARAREALAAQTAIRIE